MITKPSPESFSRQISGKISVELFDAISSVEKARGLSRAEMMTRALVLLLDELCEPVPAVSRQTLERPFPERRGGWQRKLRATQGD